VDPTSLLIHVGRRRSACVPRIVESVHSFCVRSGLAGVGVEWAYERREREEFESLRHFAVFAEVLGPSCGHRSRRMGCGWAGGGRDARPIRWCLCALSLDACSAFSADFIHDPVRRRKPFLVQSTDTVFILAGTSSAMSDELRHKTVVSVAICSQSSSKKSAIKTAWAYRADNYA
jgi:hypothetical protein